MDPTLPLLDEPPAPAADAGFGALLAGPAALPLRSLDVDARIDGLAARVTVTQTFANALGRPAEVTYVFPLPDRAAVTAFRFSAAGRVIDGVLRERARARADYERALRRGHRAAVAEEERPDVFTVRVGNLPAGEAASVRLTLVQPLLFADGEATFRFPLVVAPRYVPGTPLPGPAAGGGTAADTDAVPDASRISPPVLLPGWPNPVRLSLAVTLNPAGLEVADVRSSLHAVVTGEDAAGLRVVRLRPGERLDRDFVLRFRAAGPEARGAALAAGGTFQVTLVPPAGSARLLRPRDVVFVLDRSGSMEGWKMVAARSAVARVIDTLTAADRFAVIAFDDSVEFDTPDRRLRVATPPARTDAARWAARVTARGGTELAKPLDRALRLLADADRDRVLVLVTDGQVGNEAQLLAGLAGRLAGVRVYTLGIDTAVNEQFLRRLAALGGGSCDVVESAGRLGEVMAKVNRRLGPPVLTTVAVTAAGLAVVPDSQVPARLPDVFPGVPLVVSGRFTGTPAGGVTVTAQDAAGRPWRAELPLAAADAATLGAVWARGRLRELEDRYDSGEYGDAALEREIVDTSLAHGVLCRFTAFVAVDAAEAVNEGGRVQQIVQPVEPPAGWGDLDDGIVMRGVCAAPSVSVDSYLTEFEDASDDLDDDDEDFDEVDDLDDEGPAPPPAKFRGPSAPRRRDFFRGPSAPTPRPGAAPAVPLDAYRQRAADLLADLRAAADRPAALGVLAVRLAELLDDLGSVGTRPAEGDPLAVLLDALRRRTAADEGRLFAEAERVLSEFAGGAKRSFWKR